MRLLLISSSTVHGYGFLDHPAPHIERFLDGRTRLGFIPFAMADHAAYTAQVRERFAAMNVETTMIATAADIGSVDAIFTGGGNTFRLLKSLYDRELLAPIRDAVRNGTLYVGASAGTNIAAPTIRTTNDMPIVEPRCFDALGLIRFQVNPHYLDPIADLRHMGETREERLLQYLEENEMPVVGLREGSLLLVENGTATLVGEPSARIFRRGIPPFEAAPGTALDKILFD
jgi:dipeptidase E